MGGFRNDSKHSLLMFRKNPGFTLTALAALALGIGANTAIFSVVNSVLLKPLTYPDSDRMVEFFHKPLNRGSLLASNLASIPVFHLYQRQTAVFEDVAAYDFTSPGFNLTGDRPEQLHGIHVTEAYFRLFGARTVLGRTFTRLEDSPHGGQVVVLSYGFWQRRFGGDPGIVGKWIPLGNEPYTIVGVIGKEFFSDPDADIWLPFQFEPESTNGNQYFQAAARLKPGITLAAANAQMKLATAEYYRLFPISNPRNGEIFAVEPLRDLIIGDARRSLMVMLGAVGLVLLISCANVANLLLVRAAGRKRELAIRSALGAGRGRLIRQLLTESVLLSAGGAALGLLLGFAGVRALLAASPAGLPRLGENGSAVAMDWRVLAFTLGVSLLTGILFGLFPAFAASRADLNSSLKEGGNRFGTGFRSGKTRSLLVASEVALALVLLIGAALLIRTFMSLRAVGPGFDAQNVLTAEMSMTGARLHTTAGIAELSRNVRQRLNAIPGVEVSASTVWLPNQVDDSLVFEIAGHPEKGWAGVRWMSFSPGYLSVFKIPILRGRDFRETDTLAAPGVALINQALANRFWPSEDPVGRQIQVGTGMGVQADEPPRTIIGLVGDTHNNGLGHPPDPMLMVPTAQVVDWYAAAYSDTSAMIWAARTRGDPRRAIVAITEQLRLGSGDLPVAHVRTMEEVMGRSTARQRFNMLLLTIFGVVALVLAAIGIYGLLAYSVEQRTQEMGIRMALGADGASIRNLVVRQGMQLALAGAAVGIAAAFALTRLLSSLLFGVKPWDPAVFISAPLVLSAVALLAVWLPATHASKLDPMQALRNE
ncbi:MAG: ABC transporter permease [Terriglobia bacterium]|jgi:predicted permease